MFVVKPAETSSHHDTRHPFISEIPKGKCKLSELGINDRHHVVFVPIDQADMQLDSNDLMEIYRKIEQEFELGHEA